MEILQNSKARAIYSQIRAHSQYKTMLTPAITKDLKLSKEDVKLYKTYSTWTAEGCPRFAPKGRTALTNKYSNNVHDALKLEETLIRFPKNFDIKANITSRYIYSEDFFKGSSKAKIKEWQNNNLSFLKDLSRKTKRNINNTISKAELKNISKLPLIIDSTGLRKPLLHPLVALELLKSLEIKYKAELKAWIEELNIALEKDLEQQFSLVENNTSNEELLTLKFTATRDSFSLNDKSVRIDLNTNYIFIKDLIDITKSKDSLIHIIKPKWIKEKLDALSKELNMNFETDYKDYKSSSSVNLKFLIYKDKASNNRSMAHLRAAIIMVEKLCSVHQDITLEIKLIAWLKAIEEQNVRPSITIVKREPKTIINYPIDQEREVKVVKESGYFHLMDLSLAALKKEDYTKAQSDPAKFLGARKPSRWYEVATNPNGKLIAAKAEDLEFKAGLEYYDEKEPFKSFSTYRRVLYKGAGVKGDTYLHYDLLMKYGLWAGVKKEEIEKFEEWIRANCALKSREEMRELDQEEVKWLDEEKAKVEKENIVEVIEKEHTKEVIQTQQLDNNFFSKIIRVDKKTGYIYVQDLLKLNLKKEFKHWLENQSTKSFIVELEEEISQRILPIEEESAGRNSDRQILPYIKAKNQYEYSLVHPKLAIDLVMWLSPKFKSKCIDWLITLLTQGSVSLSDSERQQYIIRESQLQDQVSSLTEERTELQELNQIKQHEIEKHSEWIYLVKIIDRETNDCLLVKIGITENLKTRILSYFKEESNYIELIYAAKTLSFKVLEKLVKTNFKAAVGTEYYSPKYLDKIYSYLLDKVKQLNIVPLETRENIIIKLKDEISYIL